MTVREFVHAIFDRRRRDQMRKVKSPRSASQEAADRIKKEDGSAIPDELEPVRNAPSASTAASSGDGTEGLERQTSELPRQPPASSSATPSPAISDRSAARLETPLYDTEVPDDVPCEGTFATSGSSGGSLRGRAWSDPAVEDLHLGDFDTQITPEAAQEPVIMPATSNGYLRPSSGSASPATNTSCVLCLLGDSLELMMAPGDVLAVKGQGRLTEIGTAHGMLGHVLLVLQPPVNVLKNSDMGLSLQAVWPSEEVEEIWQVRSLESTRSEQGLHEADMLLYVDRATGQLILIGELQNDGTLVLTEHEAVELWQSPADLRGQIRIDLMARVLSDMKANEASWSHVTVARAILTSAQLSSGPAAETIEMVRECWKSAPICTSVVIIFWQRYLYELASGQDQHALDLILQWMPLKADRGLPGDLLGAMRTVGWVTVAQVPRIFRPMVFNGPAGTVGGPMGYPGGPALPDANCEASVMAVAREVATGGA